jgi:hypothetical protein
MEVSCALTLARKFKKRTKAPIYKMFGKDLACKFKRDGKMIRVGLVYPDVKKVARRDPSRFPTKHTDSLDQIIGKSWTNKVTHSNLFKACAICGTTEGVEIHHIRHVVDIRNSKADWFTKQMSLINRKQIPLCSEHHKKAHARNLSKADLDDYRLAIKNFKHNS